MHGLIRERLEEYLRGGPKKVPPEFEEHLRHCESCRDEVTVMQDQSQVLRVLSCRQEIDPAAGFYARVLERVEAQTGVGSFWTAFLDPVFGRRLVATSLTLACLLAGYLAFAEHATAPAVSNAEAIMATSDHPPGLGQDRQRDRETILVTLAAYQE